jgi:hypothetical protein
MKSIINFFKKLFVKTEKNIDQVDIKIEIWDPPKNVEIYHEIREAHEKNQSAEKPKKKRPAKPAVKKINDVEVPFKKERKKK